MALPALSASEVVAMSASECFEYFAAYSRYVADAPDKRYAIRVGSVTLASNDTLELRVEFENYVRRLRRKRR
jgi:hypothetical protein